MRAHRLVQAGAAGFDRGGRTPIATMSPATALLALRGQVFLRFAAWFIVVVIFTTRASSLHVA
jgi:hypothetical protein